MTVCILCFVEDDMQESVRDDKKEFVIIQKIFKFSVRIRDVSQEFLCIRNSSLIQENKFIAIRITNKIY